MSFIPHLPTILKGVFGFTLLLQSMALSVEAPMQHSFERGALKMVEGRPQYFTLERALPADVPLAAELRAKFTSSGKLRLAGRDLGIAVQYNEDTPQRLIMDADFNGRLEPNDLQADLLPAKSVTENPVFKTSAFKLALSTQPDYHARIEIVRVTHWTIDGVETRWQGALRSVGWRTGTLAWQGQNLTIGVQDDNSNGRYDDPFQVSPVSQGDLMLFDWNGDGAFRGSREVLRGGRYLFAGDQLCSVLVASGATRLDLRPFSTGTGRFHTDIKIKEVHIASEHGLLVAPVQNGAVNLPPGDYWLLQWIAKAMTPGGEDWEMKAANAAPPRIKVGPEPQSNSLLSPLAPTLSADKQQDGVRFSLLMGTKNGDTVLRLAPGAGGESAPQLRIFDLQGMPLARLKLKPEDKANFGIFWKPPADAPAVLRARLELDCGPFAVEDLPDWEFAVAQTVAQ